MYYSAIGVLAAMILLIENGDILRSGGALEKPAWKVYRRFLMAVLVYYLTDILWGFLESRKLAVLLFADTTVYFAAMAAGVLFWVQFTVAYLEEESVFGSVLVTVGRVLAGLIALLSVINIGEPLLFSVDSGAVYRALPLRYVMLACQILLLLLISGYAFSHLRLDRSSLEKRYRALGLFGLIMALFLFAQLFLPLYPLYSTAYLLGTCLLHTFVINDEKEEYKRHLAEAEEVRELQGTLRSLLDNMPAMTFTKDAETGVYLACNQAFADYAHKETPADAIGLTDAQLFDAQTAAHFVEADRVALSMDEPYVFYEEALDALGEQRQIQTTKLKYYNLSGKLCVLGMCQDVTDMVRIRRENATTKEAYEHARSSGIMYTHIAQALAHGYSTLYYVNVDTEEYIKYRNQEEGGALTEVGRGWHFFEQCRVTAESAVHPDDREAFIRALKRKTLIKALDQNGTFVQTFRYIAGEKPVYLTLTVSYMKDDEQYIILGFTNVDEEMKRRHLALRLQEEQIAYARLSALTGDFLCIYIVDPERGVFREFSATKSYDTLSLDKEGPDFFGVTQAAARRVCHPEDVNRFLSAFSKENILTEIRRRGIYTLTYRLMMEGRAVYVQLKAAMVEEEEGRRLVVGIIDIDEQVHQEEEYVTRMAKARLRANIDALTGVKNRHAYLEAEERLNDQIEERHAPAFAVVILDVNDLKKVNDSEGHNAGDQYLRDACKIIYDIFKHSAIFRIGGDEFAVIAHGSDYARMDELLERMRAHNEKALRGGGIVIACGMARYEGDDCVAPVFDRADQNMYENKTALKAKRK